MWAIGWIGCSEPAVDEDLVASGLGGATLSGRGWWVRERLVFASGAPDEERQHFLLGPTDNPCDTWNDVVPTTPDGSSCEEDRAGWAAMSDPTRVNALELWLGFWDGRDLVGPEVVEAPRGRYTRRDDDHDHLEYTFHGTRVLFDWPAAVAEALDCSAEDPWALVPSDGSALARLVSPRGTVVVSAARDDRIPFELRALEVTGADAGPSESGLLEGHGAFEGCDAETVVDPAPPP